MRPDNDADRQIKKLRTKEKLLGWVIVAIPAATTLCYFIFLRNKAVPLFLWVMVGLEWLVLVIVYLIALKMRPRRR